MLFALYITESNMFLVPPEDIRKIWVEEILLKVLSETILNTLQNHQMLGQFDCQSIVRKDNFCLNILWMQMNRKKIENCFE